MALLNTKTVLAAACIATCALSASAYHLAIPNEDGVTIYYNKISGENSVEVTYNDKAEDPGTYSGVVNIPAKVTYNNLTYSVVGIGTEAFYLSDDMTEVSLPEGITYIGDDAFDWCDQLAKINLPETLTTIGEYAFYSNAFEEITLPASLQEVGENAFRACKSLKTATVNCNPAVLGLACFGGCFSLEQFCGPYASEDGRCLLTDEGKVLNFFAFGNISSYTVPEEVEYIAPAAFYHSYYTSSLEERDYGLIEVYLPNVKVIGSYAFLDCATLENVYIGPNVSGIGSNAFANCSSLAQCKIASWNPTEITVEDGVFDGVDFKECLLLVPAGTRDLYAATAPWSDFEKIEEYTVIEEVKLSENEASLEVGDEFQLTFSVKPDDIVLPSPVWTSSDSSVATVDAEGNVKALAKGTAEISLTLGGTSNTCLVTVTDSSAIDQICVDTLPADALYYDLSGRPHSPGSLSPGIYLVRRSTTVQKLLIK